MSTWTFTVSGSDIEEIEDAAMRAAYEFFGDRVDRWKAKTIGKYGHVFPLDPSFLEFTVISATLRTTSAGGVCHEEVTGYEAEVTVTW